MAVPPVEPDVEARKRAELAGPGMGTYEELARVLPNGYRALLGPRETQSAIFE
jgi:aspartate--ammonia ligase